MNRTLGIGKRRGGIGVNPRRNQAIQEVRALLQGNRAPEMDMMEGGGIELNLGSAPSRPRYEAETAAVPKKPGWIERLFKGDDQALDDAQREADLEQRQIDAKEINARSGAAGRLGSLFAKAPTMAGGTYGGISLDALTSDDALKYEPYQDLARKAYPEQYQAQIESKLFPQAPKLIEVNGQLVPADKPGDYRTPEKPENPADTAMWNNALTAADGDPVKAREIMFLNMTGGARSTPQATPYVSRLTGNPVRLNPQTGVYMDAQNAVDAADLVEASSFNKNIETAREIQGDIGSIEQIEKEIASVPGAFDKTKTAKAKAYSTLPMYGDRLAAELFTPEELEVRAKVARNAAEIINQLYGAALSQGEEGRAKSFAPDQNDTLEQLLPKLKSAKEWRDAQRKKLLPSAISRASNQLGVQASPEVIEYARGPDGKLVRKNAPR